MSGIVQERYSTLLLGANASVEIRSVALGGFLCKTSGTISVTRGVNQPQLIVDAHPVAAGSYYPLPFLLSAHGGSVTLAGGASGTLAVA